MNHSITEVHVRKQGSRTIMQALGKSARGSKYIVGETTLEVDLVSSAAKVSGFLPALAGIIAERDSKA